MRGEFGPLPFGKTVGDNRSTLGTSHKNLFVWASVLADASGFDLGEIL